jgi:hypothetical protein
MARFPGTVDRSIARMIAVKRIATGITALAAGVVTVFVALGHGGPPTGGLVLTLAIFFGVGAWALRDGLRLRRALLERD